MQYFTGVPDIVDLAAMRDAMKKIEGDPLKINPLIPVDLGHGVVRGCAGQGEWLRLKAALARQQSCRLQDQG